MHPKTVIVIPCYNEQEVIPSLYERLSAAAETWNEPYEVIIVDDGSIDETKSVDYTEDSFDKFLSSEESDLIKED